MPNLNVDMKSTADFAVKSARERFQLELDYTDQSIPRLENIITQIYWGFSSQHDETKDSLIYNTALIWGSYLGEFMRQKWGGTWILKTADPLISIKNLEFSPIAWVYQKITNHPEYDLESFLVEAGKRIPPKLAPAPEAQFTPSNTRQPKKLISSKKLKQPLKIDKRLSLALASLGGIVFVILIVIFGYRMIKAGGISAPGLLATDRNSNPAGLLSTTTQTPTPFSTSTPFLTPTLLPTYTPKPTSTPVPSRTPTPTHTPTASNTPTETPTSTRTRVPPPPPTNTSAPPIVAPPTAPPAVVLQSCTIDPSTVPIGTNVTITLIAQFSAPGYGFQASLDPNYDQSSACGANSGSDGRAYCDGSSGVLPAGATVTVTFTSPVGNCVAGYSSQ